MSTRRRGLGYSSKKHDERGASMMRAYNETVARAKAFAADGRCEEALTEVVRAAYRRGNADAHDVAGSMRFNAGGPGEAEYDLAGVLKRCRREARR